jgi:hypothetical protein
VVPLRVDLFTKKTPSNQKSWISSVESICFPMGFKGATVNDVGVVPKSPGQLRSGYQIAARDTPRRATMSGFGERMQRAARERIETFRRDASAAPAFAVRVRPLRQARALAANANGALGVPDAVAFVVEPKTGLRLPGEFCVRGQTSDCAPLAGMGVRVKRIAGVGVKVYACGLYVHPKQAKQSRGGCAPWARRRRRRRGPEAFRRAASRLERHEDRASDVRQGPGQREDR